MDQYADGALGFVDACIIALAERLRITRVLTPDQRRFRFMRPRHCTAFEIVP
jgi:predicted nucleic acid-binding protein